MRKLLYEYIKKSFEKEGYELISIEYINSKQKLEYICQNGHKHSITWNNWKTGRRCPCETGMLKPTVDFIKVSFAKEGYQLLTKCYINAQQQLDYMCPAGHRHHVSWNNWSSKNTRCPICANVKRRHALRLSIDFITLEFASEGYKLLTKSYKNNRQKLICVCPKGHEYSITWGGWQGGHRCPYCAGSVRLKIEFIRSEFAKEGYRLLTKKYINNKQKLEYICSNGHRHSISWAEWGCNKNRCPTCFFVKNSGSNHPNWQGGISCEPYCDAWADKEYKKSILARDGDRCQNPDCWRTNERLVIHHINYNKKNCGPKNLITLCASCNGRANFDREWHTSWYQTILNKKQGYIYDRKN